MNIPSSSLSLQSSSTPYLTPSAPKGLLIGSIVGGVIATLALVTLVVACKVRRASGQCKGSTSGTIDSDHDSNQHITNGNKNDADEEDARSVIPMYTPTNEVRVSSMNKHSSRMAQQRDWLARSMTTETDATPIASNVTKRGSNGYRTNNFIGRIIQEGGDEESEH